MSKLDISIGLKNCSEHLCNVQSQYRELSGAAAGVMYSAFIKAPSRTESEDIGAVSAAAPGERCHSEQTGAGGRLCGIVKISTRNKAKKNALPQAIQTPAEARALCLLISAPVAVIQGAAVS